MIRLRSLGECLIEVGDTRVTPAAGTVFATALYLVLEGGRSAQGGRAIARRELVDVLWADADDRRAQQRLRQTLYRLNAMGAALRSDGAHVVLPARSVSNDCAALLDVADGTDVEQLADGILGPFLPGYAPRLSARFTDWLEQQRDLVTAALRRVLVNGMVSKRERGEWQAAEALALRCLALDPLNEEATLVLAEAAALNGSKVRALSILDEYLDELGPDAGDIRLPATVLRRRIAEVYQSEIRPVRQIPHIGREAEVAELSRALGKASEGHGSSYVIWGEPGIGKTRLVTEFTRAAELKRAQVARVACQAHDGRRPLSAFVDLVPELLELRGAIGAAPESMKYLRRLIAHDPEDNTLSPDSGESELLFSNIRRSLFDLLDAVASEDRLILVIENVQWLDRRSWEILREMVPWVAERQVMVLLTSRVDGVMERFPDGQPAPTVMPVGPLDDAASRELLRRATAGTEREENARFHDWCIRSAGGNPYYLTELALQATWDGARYRAPATLGKLVAARLTRLGALPKRVLQACSVLGKLSTLDRLERVLDERRVALLGALEELEALGLVESELPRVSCKHDLLAVAAMQQLSTLSRALLHRHAAQVLDGEARDSKAAAVVWECAEHWQQAGERERAMELLKACAHHAIELGLPTEAVPLLEHAVSLASSPEELLELLPDQVRALQLADYWERLPATIEHLQQLREQSGAACDRHTSEELLAVEAEWHIGADLSHLYEHAKSCVRSTDASPEHRVRAATLALMLADNLCIREDADDLYAEVEQFLDGGVGAYTRCYLQMVYYSSFGDIGRAPGAARELVSHAREHGNVAILSRCLRHASVAYAVGGIVADAEAAALEAFRIAERAGLENTASMAAGRLVAIYTSVERIADAERWYAEARAQRAKLFGPIDSAVLMGHGAVLALKKGAYDEAEMLLEQIDQKLRTGGSLRHTLETTAVRAALKMSRDQQIPDESEIATMLDLHFRARSSVSHDYFALTMFRALEAKSLRERRAELVGEYLARYRRERSPLLPELREFLASVTPPDAVADSPE